jgi:CPA2 family monovalent cation:H+ antiporter-2
MDLWFFLMELAMLLGGAFFLGALAQRMRQSPILGYILSGAIIGPLVFNATAVNQAAELGVSLLLFSIGLEFSFQQMRKLGRIALGGGAIQIVVTMIIVTILTVAHLSPPQALTLGAIVALSSTTVVLRILVDRAEIDSVRGQASLGILLLQDIAIVPLILMVSLFSPAGPDSNTGLQMLKIIMAVIVLALIFYLLLYRIAPLLLSQKALFANRELTVLLAVSVGLGAAWAAHAVHISPAMGAFVAGLLLGESPFATQIRSDIGALRIIMVTLFFASVGMLAKPLWFFIHLHWILAAAIAVFVIKTIIIFGVLRLFGLNSRQAIATGITLGQVGEFSFVLAATAREGSVLAGNTIDLIISVVIVLMLATPYMVAMAHPAANRLTSLLSRPTAATKGREKKSDSEPANRALVVGLGPAGFQVVTTLMERKLEAVVIEMNPEGRVYARQLGIRVHLGDASHEDVLKHAGLSDVCMAVVTIPDPGMAVRIVQMIRRLRPELVIAARCRYSRRMSDLERAGADIVIDEETTMGEMLGQKIMEGLEESSGSIMACRMGGQTPEVSF